MSFAIEGFDRFTQSGERQSAHARAPSIMLIPSFRCPASCAYCFGPHGGEVMSQSTLDAALAFMSSIVEETGGERVQVTFHGGEPLTAGRGLLETAITALAERFGNQQLKLGLQSNLWLLDEGIAQLLVKHGVEVGTSIDGPRWITDAQRGEGYFDRTTSGLETARRSGINPGCVATLTRRSLPYWRAVVEWFLERRLSVSLRVAVPEMGACADGLTVPPREWGGALDELLDYYVENRRDLRVPSLDQMCQGVAAGQAQVCTFRDCLGMFLAIDPHGDIFPCQRFAGRPEWRLGTLSRQPSLNELLAAPVAQRFAARQERVERECAGCAHLSYCRGGCPYNAWAAGGAGQVRDPYCESYRQAWTHIRRRLEEEMADPVNIDAVAAGRWDRRTHPLLKRGALIELARQGPHPSDVARTARRIVAAVELARGPDIGAVSRRLTSMGVCRSLASARISVAGLRCDLEDCTGALNNLYAHVTFRCQLNCTHCYARADGAGGFQADMPTEAAASLVRQAKQVGFRKLVVTGGEPLIHTDRDGLLETLGRLRVAVAPMRLVLRTNFALPLNDPGLLAVAAAFDEVAVSLDGDAQAHDARRGRGAYAAMRANCERYQRLVSNSETERAGAGPPLAELSLACVLRAEDMDGEAAAAAEDFAEDLGIRRVRLRPLLPLGRARDWSEPPSSEALGAASDSIELIERGFRPVATCGLGRNLCVDPSGKSFPCYACHGAEYDLGNVITGSLTNVVASAAFRELARRTVDSNEKCRHCDVRYLCGGACRAWNGPDADLDAPPPECAGLRARAERLLEAARDYLGLVG